MKQSLRPGISNVKRFSVDRDRTILFASANEEFTDRPEPLEILSLLESGR